jgi:hypothetical protein
MIIIPYPVVSQGDISAVRLLVTEGIMIIHPVVSQGDISAVRLLVTEGIMIIWVDDHYTLGN